MIGQRVNRGDPERLFCVFKNNEGSSIPAGSAVSLELTAASADGVNIVQPNSGELLAVVGILDATTATGDYCLVQVYGYRSTALIYLTNASYSKGVPLVPVAGSNCMSSGTSQGTTLYPSLAVMMEDRASSATATDAYAAKVFIKAM